VVPQLPGVDQRWSRFIVDGKGRQWHVLDTGADGRFATQPPVLTLLCVHGNPTWSLLWRRLLIQAPAQIRVMAVDQLQMGWSARLDGRMRRLAQRIDDLDDLTTALDLRGPVVTVAHDWGGPISLGWALKQRTRQVHSTTDANTSPPVFIRGVVLMNTAVHQPADSSAPFLIRLARIRALRWWVTVRTQLFLRVTLGLSRNLNRADGSAGMDAATAAAFRAPYATAQRRRAIGAFVADIPLKPDHPSMATLQNIAEQVRTLQDVPVLLLWGAGDPVFSDRYLRDVVARLPHADVHRYPRARHLVIEDDPRVVPDLLLWIQERVIGTEVSDPRTAPEPAPAALCSAIEQAVVERPDEVALWDLSTSKGAPARRLTWGELGASVQRAATGLSERGVRPGDRVAILVPPGPEAIAIIYACWRVGAVVVIADRGLGVRGMRRALRAALPDHAIGIRPGRILARTLGLPGSIIDPESLLRSPSMVLPAGPMSDELAAVVYTSGSTGPAKGVRYRHSQIARTCALLREHYNLTSDDVLVAAFAPWAILGPALGMASVIPRMDVTAPASLHADALADAVRLAGGTVLWASPAALRNVQRTARPDTTVPELRLVLGAGAPVPPGLLEQLAPLFPNAELRTPYGMTEVLPVTDVTLTQLREAGLGPGVMVGHPLPEVEIMIDPLIPGLDLGEICVRAPHMRDGYDRLWGMTAAASPLFATDSVATGDDRPRGRWHRTGDVGTVERSATSSADRLWVAGRRAHVIWTTNGPVAPVPIEQRVQTLPWVQWCAVVGVGPVHLQQIVVIVIPDDVTVRRSRPWAGAARSSQVRVLVHQALGLEVAAVLQRAEFPVDVRHQAKIDRTALAAWADAVLAGHR
jgi:acyl-CoA synthetase (AMP-forming)/AMP-acid ligase II/pimeloyl-ACP methyl ester carboxylesterase